MQKEGSFKGSFFEKRNWTLHDTSLSISLLSSPLRVLLHNTHHTRRNTRRFQTVLQRALCVRPNSREQPLTRRCSVSPTSQHRAQQRHRAQTYTAQRQTAAVCPHVMQYIAMHQGMDKSLLNIRDSDKVRKKTSQPLCNPKKRCGTWKPCLSMISIRFNS